MTLAVGIGLFAAVNLQGMSSPAHSMQPPAVLTESDNPDVEVLLQALNGIAGTFAGDVAVIQTLPSDAAKYIDQRRVAMIGSYAWIQEPRKPDLGIALAAPMLQWPGLSWIALSPLPIALYIQQAGIGKE